MPDQCAPCSMVSCHSGGCESGAGELLMFDQPVHTLENATRWRKDPRLHHCRTPRATEAPARCAHAITAHRIGPSVHGTGLADRVHGPAEVVANPPALIGAGKTRDRHRLVRAA